MASYPNEFEFIINEDGSITRKKYSPIERPLSKGEYGARPSIMKFNCSSDHMKCGEQVKMYWAIQDADEVSITISQGSYSTTELMPSEGEITLTSNISADDIKITMSVSGKGEQLILGANFQGCPDTITASGRTKAIDANNCKKTSLSSNTNTVVLGWTTKLDNANYLFGGLLNVSKMPRVFLDTCLPEP